MFRSLPTLCIALAFAAPQTAGAYEQLPRPLASLSPADFAREIDVVDDPLEPAVVLSTHQGYARGRAIKGAHANDVHLRALVDRASGRVTWQVWHELITVRGHKQVTAVHFLAGGNLRQVAPFAVDHWLDQCPATDAVGSCNQFTRVGFELTEDMVREIATAYAAGSREPWRLRFKVESGRDVTGGLAPAEAAGLLQAVEAWHAAPKARTAVR